MGKIKNIFICAAAVGLFASCAKDRALPENAVQGITVKVLLPTTTVTRAAGTPEDGTAEENKITNLKIFFTKVISANDATIEKIYDFDPSISQILDASSSWDATTQSLKVRQLEQGGYDGSQSIIAIANWANDLSGYHVGDSYLKLKDEFTQSEVEVVSPFVMLGNTLFDVNIKDYTVKLERQPIKVEVTVALDAKFAAAYPDFDFGILTPMMGVHSTPNRSSLIYSEQGVTGSQYVNIEQKNTEQIDAGKKSWKATFYLYENPTKGTDVNNATKFILWMPYQRTGSATKYDNYYTILLKTDDATNPYKTDRNTIYRVSATINGFGSTTPVDIPSNITAIVSVVPWDDEAYDDQIGGGSLSLNKSHVVLEHNYLSELKCTTNSQEDIEVIASDASKVKITKIREGRITTISLQAVITADKNEDTDEYATLTIKHKNVTRKVKISYQALWAKGNIIVKNGRYAIGEPQDYGLYFKALSVIGMKHIGDNIPWLATHKYYEPDASGNVIEKSGYTWADIPFYITGADPCRLIKDGSAKWKTPTYQDFSELMKYTDYNVRPDNYREFYGGIVYLPMPGHIGADGVGYPGTSVGHDGFYWTTTINNAELEDIDCLVRKGVVDPISLIKPVFRFGVSDSLGWGAPPENMATLRFRGGKPGFNVRCIRDKQN